MQPFAYAAAADAAAASAAALRGAEYIAGGTDMLQLLQERVRRPEEIADVNGLPLGGITEEPGGALRLGALVRLQEAADHAALRQRFAVVAEALDATASPMVRHMATLGGNLLQRTRCLYFRDVTTPCNKREPGSGCGAWDGENRHNAILGGSERCIAVQPSDLPVALIAVDAEVLLRHADGAEHWVPMEDFHLLPTEHPEIETVLRPGDLILAIRIPAHAALRRSHYVKVRDRASFAWALASAAVALRTGDDGRVEEARIAAGGVATKPWRLPQVEQVLLGRRLDAACAAEAAARATEGALPRPGNAYKLPMLRAAVERAILELGGLA
ncbi:FAD binding domain-containing protein [Paracraurococcus lichenis]|uniref:FAD binding domain-containing protein n=1 Tax=Paracraurococcus lichenis TaxID=3064888 RepID=A0ABT9E7X9_9PROT|nr:FAD binding domain-containing protein [Paracraurococcus sp. LOR1-02]MDO9712279.1 FAD binding domain-containing protein [Paracraurococcus sp. LOR1-02]